MCYQGIIASNLWKFVSLCFYSTCNLSSQRLVTRCEFDKSVDSIYHFQYILLTFANMIGSLGSSQYTLQNCKNFFRDGEHPQRRALAPFIAKLPSVADKPAAACNLTLLPFLTGVVFFWEHKYESDWSHETSVGFLVTSSDSATWVYISSSNTFCPCLGSWTTNSANCFSKYGSTWIKEELMKTVAW